MLCFPCVVNRALLTGLMMAPVVELLTITHEDAVVPLHTPCDVRLSVYPFKIWLWVILVASVVIVGTMWSPFASAYAFFSSFVVQSNEPLP